MSTWPFFRDAVSPPCNEKHVPRSGEKLLERNGRHASRSVHERNPFTLPRNTRLPREVSSRRFRMLSHTRGQPADSSTRRLCQSSGASWVQWAGLCGRKPDYQLAFAEDDPAGTVDESTSTME